jgi:hypothetical protein
MRGQEADCYDEAVRHIEAKEPISATDCLLILASGSHPEYQKKAAQKLQVLFPAVPLPEPAQRPPAKRAAPKPTRASQYDKLLRSVRYTFDCRDLPYNNKTMMSEQLDMDSRIKSALRVAAASGTIRENLYLFEFLAYLPAYDPAQKAYDLSGAFTPACGNNVPEMSVAFPTLDLPPTADKKIRDSSGGTCLVEWLVRPDRIELRAGPDGNEEWVLWRLADARATVTGFGSVYMKK